eukprot:7382541-Prymnesium_polylepis.3
MLPDALHFHAAGSRVFADTTRLAAMGEENHATGRCTQCSSTSRCTRCEQRVCMYLKSVGLYTLPAVAAGVVWPRDQVCGLTVDAAP